MFKKILIANRGEIACRIARTVRRMGISTVAVYSEADANAPHVRAMDEALPIGPAPAQDSYLDIAKIVQAAVEAGADAVHPGYGFLSENAALPDALKATGVSLIGPPATAMKLMGDKLEAKRLALEVGVEALPGGDTTLADAEDAVVAAQAIGYPVMLKAAAGGGGKGMRIAQDDDEVRAGFRFAMIEAKSSFGDDRVFVEKLIERPRHIEVHILADHHGSIVHLGERECSIQRRHQKVIEETPAPVLDDVTRTAMADQAVTLARAVDYRSAGTVEFIVDQDDKFYFLEMNTRLQVEHPVTELVTGVDLVEQMIRIAAGEPLALTQHDIAPTGWAIEARIYAEDPFRGFLPSSGRLVRYLPPVESAGVRIDSGVEEGGEIDIHYDPLIAKLICHGATREQARQRLRRALDAYYIRGISQNVAFLAAVLAHPRFASGDLSTGFIEEEYPDGFSPADTLHDDPLLLAALAGALHYRASRWHDGIACVALIGDREFPMTVSGLATGEAGCNVSMPTKKFEVNGDWRPGLPLFDAHVDGLEVCVQVDREGDVWRLTHAGVEARVAVLTPRSAELNRLMPARSPPDHSRFVLSLMPGLLVRLAVSEGLEVKVGEEVAVIEAMKMENQIRAERDGTIRTIHAAPGDLLEVDQPIVEFV